MKRLSRIGMIAGTAALIAARLGSASAWASSRCCVPEPNQRVHAQDWKLAAVFRREDDRRVYVGTVLKPKIPLGVGNTLQHEEATSTSGTPIPAADYEIWLARDGETRGLWYSSAGRKWGELVDSSRPGPARSDEGALKRLVRQARPPRWQGPQRADSQASASWLAPPPRTLADLCAPPRVIAVGRVVGIVRQDHTPIGSMHSDQHTVYAFAVEQFLKSAPPGARPLLKVWQEGGSLPWVEADGLSRGVGAEVREDPMLNIGDRYILFLGLPTEPRFLKLGYVPGMVGGFEGKIAELDEYKVTHHGRGKILLRYGMTQAPQFLGTPEDHWRFTEGPQILDVPEATAIQAIRQTVANLSRP